MLDSLKLFCEIVCKYVHFGEKVCLMNIPKKQNNFQNGGRTKPNMCSKLDGATKHCATILCPTQIIKI